MLIDGAWPLGSYISTELWLVDVDALALVVRLPARLTLEANTCGA
jgi:hypothetical protein